jgi:hypothetical protein
MRNFSTRRRTQSRQTRKQKKRQRLKGGSFVTSPFKTTRNFFGKMYNKATGRKSSAQHEKAWKIWKQNLNMEKAWEEARAQNEKTPIAKHSK